MSTSLLTPERNSVMQSPIKQFDAVNSAFNAFVLVSVLFCKCSCLIERLLVAADAVDDDGSPLLDEVGGGRILHAVCELGRLREGDVIVKEEDLIRSWSMIIASTSFASRFAIVLFPDPGGPDIWVRSLRCIDFRFFPAEVLDS